MLIIGIGNILEKDDGVGVYASTYLKRNFEFSPEIEIINGGSRGEFQSSLKIRRFKGRSY